MMLGEKSMASPSVLDFDRLLKPITPDQPAGVNLREDFSPANIYHTIKDARAKARSIERQGLADEQGKPAAADWKPVYQLSPKALSEKTKDLEIVGWLIESLARLQGFAGLRDGFSLARQLCELFWDQLYPRPDVDGVSTRVAPLTGLNGEEVDGTLIQPINLIALTASPNLGPFTRASYRQASDLEAISDPDKKKARIDRGAVSLDMFMRAVAESSPAFYLQLLEDLRGAIAEFDNLGLVLDARCGNDASGRSMSPPTSNIRNALKSCEETIVTVAKNKLGSSSSLPIADTAGATVAAGGNGQGGLGQVSGSIRNRSEAFEHLLTVARFFRDTEPQSPVSYALEQVVRWGRLPLPALWSELIPEESARLSLFKLVGIPPVESKKD